MRAPWWLKLRSTKPRGRSVVFEFTIEDRFTDAMIKVAEATDRVATARDFRSRVEAERAVGLAVVEAIVDNLGHGFGIDPRVWQAERRENRADRMRAERRAWWAARQAPSHPEFIGRRP